MMLTEFLDRIVNKDRAIGYCISVYKRNHGRTDILKLKVFALIVGSIRTHLSSKVNLIVENRNKDFKCV